MISFTGALNKESLIVFINDFLTLGFLPLSLPCLTGFEDTDCLAGFATVDYL